tara:strand:- start:16542 stop:17906 length:1365 start_codon:yes stop_codon:yes gene_type:complete
MDLLIIKILAFFVAIVILIGVHEFGHFWVAKKLGIKVLRFSIGFGRPLFSWIGKKDETEYVFAAIPLGGYVKMLDENEGKVDPSEINRAFNRQPLLKRTAVVLAGPAFNLFFAIFAFALISMIGETGLKPIIGKVERNSIAEQIGLAEKDKIFSVKNKKTPTWNHSIVALVGASFSDDDVTVEVIGENGLKRTINFDPKKLSGISETRNPLLKLGIRPDQPKIPPIFGTPLKGYPADSAGIKEGDRLISADKREFTHWSEWVEYVRARPLQNINVVVDRNGKNLSFELKPNSITEGDFVIGQIGVANNISKQDWSEYRITYTENFFNSVVQGVSKTIEYSLLTLKVIWRILTGESSIKNLSGPFTIADAAGKTASYGFIHFLKFLAIVSISLGVLNLLPVPILDGGHLVYFAIEAIIGKPIPDSWLLGSQKIGIIILIGLTVVAFYVDIQRFFG